MSLPCRSKCLCGRTWTITCRSPGSPPPRAASPCRGIDIRCPWAIPAGIVTFTRWRFLTTPCPLQVEHGLSTTVPSPLHVGQTDATEKKPLLRRTCPAPPHVGHVLRPEPEAAPVPLHASHGASRSYATS